MANELTGDTAFQLADGLSRLDLNDHDGVILQLGPHSHIDVNGLAVIVRIFSHLKSRHKRLYVAGAPDRIGRALNRLGLSKVLRVPDMAHRAPVDTDPSLSALTGQFAAVPDSAEIHEDPVETKILHHTLNNAPKGPSTPVTRSLTNAD